MLTWFLNLFRRAEHCVHDIEWFSIALSAKHGVCSLCKLEIKT